MNRKGFSITYPVIILILSLIVVLLFIISSTFRWILLGISLFVMSAWIIYSMDDYRGKLIGMLVLITLAIFFIFGHNIIPQSVLSLSKVYEGSNGKVYWVWYASANKPGEKYVFNYQPTKYTKNDGSVVTPTKSLTLEITPGQPICKYQLNKITKNNLFGSISYYVLSSPEKIMNINICSGDYVCKTLDATVVNSVIINDRDNSGKVVVETQGILGSKFNCPSQSNVALIYDEDTKTYKFYYKDELDDYINSHYSYNIWETLISLWYSKNNIHLNSEFTSNIIDEPIVDLNNNVLKLKIPFGYPTFTITADQDYFDSTYYIKPQTIIPKIVDINYPSTVKINDRVNIKLIIKNKEEFEGLSIIKASSNVGDISPQSINTKINNYNKEIDFTLNTNNNVGCGKINFEVCGLDQFVESNCVKKNIDICLVNDEVKEYCGDDICQDYEDFNSCPEDCKSNVVDLNNNKTIICKWYQQPYTKYEKDYGFMYWRAIFNNPKVKEVSGCRTADWMYVVYGIIVILILIIISIIILKLPKSNNIGDKI